jgi:hypothetical protein
MGKWSRDAIEPLHPHQRAGDFSLCPNPGPGSLFWPQFLNLDNETGLTHVLLRRVPAIPATSPAAQWEPGQKTLQPSSGIAASPWSCKTESPKCLWRPPHCSHLRGSPVGGDTWSFPRWPVPLTLSNTGASKFLSSFAKRFHKPGLKPSQVQRCHLCVLRRRGTPSPSPS